MIELALEIHPIPEVFEALVAYLNFQSVEHFTLILMIERDLNTFDGKESRCDDYFNRKLLAHLEADFTTKKDAARSASARASAGTFRRVSTGDPSADKAESTESIDATASAESIARELETRNVDERDSQVEINQTSAPRKRDPLKPVKHVRFGLPDESDDRKRTRGSKSGTTSWGTTGTTGENQGSFKCKPPNLGSDDENDRVDRICLKSQSGKWVTTRTTNWGQSA